jgi:hypothetical protein
VLKETDGSDQKKFKTFFWSSMPTYHGFFFNAHISWYSKYYTSHANNLRTAMLKATITRHVHKAIEFEFSNWYFFHQLRLFVKIELFSFRILHYFWFYFPSILYILFNLFIDLVKRIQWKLHHNLCRKKLNIEIKHVYNMENSKFESWY